MMFRWMCVLLLAGSLLIACGGNPVATSTVEPLTATPLPPTPTSPPPTPTAEPVAPPEINYGHDFCDECNMIIGYDKFAAATILASGEAHKFDEVSNMLFYHLKHPDEQVRAWFVHDYASKTWIRGETAFYVQSAAIITPMNDGIIAFEQEADAQEVAAAKNGETFTFEEIQLVAQQLLQAKEATASPAP
ncbi:MAG: nitrous oxide reductase accessory protein NosL [Chloroflexota bacterium]|mgnify:FL=1